MKKLLSVIISVIAVATLTASFAVPAMAAVNVYSPEAVVIEHQANDPSVNKMPSNQVTGSQQAPGSNIVEFTYTGSLELIGWNLVDKNGNEIPLSKTAESYRIVSQDGNKLVIEILDWSYFESPDGYTINAIVKGAETESGKKDDSSKSPSTGVASVAFASVAAMGAGVALLSLSKKKDAE